MKKELRGSRVGILMIRGGFIGLRLLFTRTFRFGMDILPESFAWISG